MMTDKEVLHLLLTELGSLNYSMDSEDTMIEYVRMNFTLDTLKECVDAHWSEYGPWSRARVYDTLSSWHYFGWGVEAAQSYLLSFAPSLLRARLPHEDAHHRFWETEEFITAIYNLEDNASRLVPILTPFTLHEDEFIANLAQEFIDKLESE